MVTSSCPDLIRASIILHSVVAKKMNCRVKPGNDGLGGRSQFRGADIGGGPRPTGFFGLSVPM
jgi:hypothetical protein